MYWSINFDTRTASTQEFLTILEDIFVMTRIIAFERYNFICRKHKKSESLEQFHANLVELASRADCGDRESEWVRDLFTDHMNNEKIAMELLAQARTPQEAYKYAIRREKGTEHSRTMKVNPIAGQTVTPPKQEPIRYVNTRGRLNQQYNLTKIINEAGEIFAVVNIHVDHKSQGVNNINSNNGTIIQNNVSNVETNMVQNIYNLVQQKTKFVLNMQNVDILRKFVVPQTSIISAASMRNNKKKKQ